MGSRPSVSTTRRSETNTLRETENPKIKSPKKIDANLTFACEKRGQLDPEHSPSRIRGRRGSCFVRQGRGSELDEADGSRARSTIVASQSARWGEERAARTLCPRNDILPCADGRIGQQAHACCGKVHRVIARPKRVCGAGNADCWLLRSPDLRCPLDRRPRRSGGSLVPTRADWRIGVLCRGCGEISSGVPESGCNAVRCDARRTCSALCLSVAALTALRCSELPWPAALGRTLALGTRHGGKMEPHGSLPRAGSIRLDLRACRKHARGSLSAATLGLSRPHERALPLALTVGISAYASRHNAGLPSRRRSLASQLFPPALSNPASVDLFWRSSPSHWARMPRSMSPAWHSNSRNAGSPNDVFRRTPDITSPSHLARLAGVPQATPSEALALALASMPRRWRPDYLGDHDGPFQCKKAALPESAICYEQLHSALRD